MIREIKKKDKIIKDHNKYTHIITIEYPHKNIQNMKASWRRTLEEGGEWLSQFDDGIAIALKEGFARLKQETEKANDQIATELAISNEELFRRYKKEHLLFIKGLQAFVKDLKQRKKDFELEVRKEMEKMKKKIVQDLNEKKEALKLWKDK